VRGDLTGWREYIGNKIDLQTKNFHWLISIIYVPLFGLLAKGSDDDLGVASLHWPGYTERAGGYRAEPGAHPQGAPGGSSTCMPRGSVAQERVHFLYAL
jgi:hypothetical protein